jgi:hypothetical protein
MLRDMDAVMEIAMFAVDEGPDPLKIPGECAEEQWSFLDNEFGDEIAEKWTGEMTEKEFERGMDALEELQDL